MAQAHEDLKKELKAATDAHARVERHRHASTEPPEGYGTKTEEHMRIAREKRIHEINEMRLRMEILRKF
jgi:hypothetical protein